MPESQASRKAVRRRHARSAEAGAEAVWSEAGAREIDLAAPWALGDLGLELSRLELEPGACAPWAAGDSGEHVLYVIRGSGTARAGERTFELAPESVLWLEPGERCALVAGDVGLDALAARAPAVPSRKFSPPSA